MSIFLIFLSLKLFSMMLLGYRSCAPKGGILPSSILIYSCHLTFNFSVFIKDYNKQSQNFENVSH